MCIVIRNSSCVHAAFLSSARRALVETADAQGRAIPRTFFVGNGAADADSIVAALGCAFAWFLRVMRRLFLSPRSLAEI